MKSSPQGSQSAQSATKSSLQGSQSAAPATKSALQGPYAWYVNGHAQTFADAVEDKCATPAWPVFVENQRDKRLHSSDSICLSISLLEAKSGKVQEEEEESARHWMLTPHRGIGVTASVLRFNQGPDTYCVREPFCYIRSNSTGHIPQLWGNQEGVSTCFCGGEKRKQEPNMLNITCCQALYLCVLRCSFHLFRGESLDFYVSRFEQPTRPHFRSRYLYQPILPTGGKQDDGGGSDDEGGKVRKYKRYLLSDSKSFDALFFPEKPQLLKLVDDFMQTRGKFASLLLHEELSTDCGSKRATPTITLARLAL
ncbi:unnamed protein product [Durusdinium trenchii]|uniref:Uncharacterized protein n=1 Tax=Durusdinium trenchii TaxID=1381693 RepID=A0ABP0LER5_9DINO